MKVSRRSFVAGTAGAGLLAHAPGLASPVNAGLRLVAPGLVTGLGLSGTITATGDRLMATMLARRGTWHSIEAVMGEADMQLLAELVRFEPGLRWSAELLPAGISTFAGTTLRTAYAITAAREFPASPTQ